MAKNKAGISLVSPARLALTQLDIQWPITLAHIDLYGRRKAY